MIMKDRQASNFKELNALERYRQFLVDYPGLEARIKQHQLASYLGITPVSLSRIRKKLDLIK
jgi:CRP-like cAMP-binding protein